ncbi:MAG: 5-oxoprolinase, partial [Acidiphilium sp. 21-62-4]
MAHAIRQITVQRGRNPADFVLTSFGGAGGQHACLVADELGMDRIFIHPLAGVLSAYGMGLADFLILREQAVEITLTPDAVDELQSVASMLESSAVAALWAQDVAAALIQTKQFVHLRYSGTDAPLPVTLADYTAMVAEFEAAHQRLFGFITAEKSIIAETVAVEAMAPGDAVGEAALGARTEGVCDPVDDVQIFTAGAAHTAPVFERTTLLAGDKLTGPAMIREANATTIIEPGWQAEVTAQNHVILRRIAPRDNAVVQDISRADPVLLELFNNLFMAIAEQCGSVLRNTAQSVNIKERLDFSCALFDAAGGLIANAPHVPVHLGAMGESVRAVIRSRGGSLKPGDAVALNNP